MQIAKKPYQFLLISALREYLTMEFEPQQPLPFPYDPERIIDDFGTRLKRLLVLPADVDSVDLQSFSGASEGGIMVLSCAVTVLTACQ